MIGRVFIVATSLATLTVLSTAPACCETRPAAKVTPRPTPKAEGWYTREIRTRQVERRQDERRNLRDRQARARYQADEAWKDDLDDDEMDDDVEE